MPLEDTATPTISRVWNDTAPLQTLGGALEKISFFSICLKSNPRQFKAFKMNHS